MLRISGVVLFSLFVILGGAQVIDSVLVEEYHRSSSKEGEELVTYRIYIDLAQDHQLQMVYGDQRNQLEFHTTTVFFNDTLNGEKFGDKIDPGMLDTSMLAFDSWLTIGAATDSHWGVPLDLDTDGSLLGSNAGKHLSERDGLMPVNEVKDVVNFKMEHGYLGSIPGPVIHTMDGAWAVLGGTKGVTEKNIVLIAQLTTSGELSFKLNLQVRDPEGQMRKVVSTSPNEAEEYYEGLRHGRYAIERTTIE